MADSIQIKVESGQPPSYTYTEIYSHNITDILMWYNSQIRLYKKYGLHNLLTILAFGLVCIQEGILGFNHILSDDQQELDNRNI